MSPKKEDYVKVLFDLGGRTEKIQNKKIADRLGLSPPTVTEMMISLEKIGWLKYTPYKGSILTADGAERAKALIHKHRLWEVFLVNNLGFDIEAVHDEAEILEHSTSTHLATQLEEYLGYPEYCPHGGAIPLGLIDTQEKRTHRLSDVQQRVSVVISRVVNEGKIVAYFKQANLNIGDILQVLEYDSKFDLFYIRNCTQNTTVEVSGTIARYLFVECQNETDADMTETTGSE